MGLRNFSSNLVLLRGFVKLYSNFVSTLGGKEKLNNICNQLNCSSFY